MPANPPRILVDHARALTVAALLTLGFGTSLPAQTGGYTLNGGTATLASYAASFWMVWFCFLLSLLYDTPPLWSECEENAKLSVTRVYFFVNESGFAPLNLPRHLKKPGSILTCICQGSFAIL